MQEREDLNDDALSSIISITNRDSTDLDVDSSVLYAVILNSITIIPNSMSIVPNSTIIVLERDDHLEQDDRLDSRLLNEMTVSV